MDSQHTLGPWNYNPQSANRLTGPNGETVAATYGGIVGAAEQNANTRLIAFAPSMYEYIKKMATRGDQEAQAIGAAVEGLVSEHKESDSVSP